MRRIAWLWAVVPIALFGSSLRAQSDAARRQITALEDQWIKAVVARDARAFDRMMHADFTYTEDDHVYTKAQLIKDIMTGTDTVAGGQNEDLKVKIFGNTAIATGWLVLRGRGPKGPFVRRYRYTDTWLRSGNVWQIIAAADYLKP